MGGLEGFLQNIVDFTATLDPRMAVLLFVICAIGEVGLSVPLLLEFLWVNIGINLGKGVLSPFHMVLLWAAAQCGRQVGAIALYRIARFGMPALTRFYHKIHLDRIFNKLMSKSTAINRINLSSPFSVAFARLVGMRIPMVLVLAVKKRPGMLALGVLLSSMIFDGLYITVGAIFGKTIEIKPMYTVLITVGILIVIYLVTFLIRFFIKRRRQSNQPVGDLPPTPPRDKAA